MIQRIKLTLQYRGTQYSGWQVQPNGVTIQELLQKAVKKIFNQNINVVGSGRTDAGVHALAQVCHFDLEVDHVGLPLLSEGDHIGSPLHNHCRGRPACLPSRPVYLPNKLVLAINSQLPDDIAVSKAELVSQTFHAQRSAKKKQYNYYILNSPLRSPFLDETVWRITPPLDLKKMRRAARCLVGTHDFKAFCASDSSVKTTVRRIYKITLSSLISSPYFKGGVGGVMQISVTGNGFLKHMVRNIVGTLVDVGRGRIAAKDVKKILQSRDRRQAGKNAPARGLLLVRVEY